MKIHNIPSLHQALHPEAFADAWEAVPRMQRVELLARAGFPGAFVGACAESRFAFLPVGIRLRLEGLLDARVVRASSDSLKAREREGREPLE